MRSSRMGNVHTLSGLSRLSTVLLEMVQTSCSLNETRPIPLNYSLSTYKDHTSCPVTILTHCSLIFVANLATFTSYHSISDRGQLFSYIGFFSVIWSSWFQITLHDVRFARDSVYERACKMVQFVAFVGFALVGSGFNPTGTEVNTVISAPVPRRLLH